MPRDGAITDVAADTRLEVDLFQPDIFCLGGIHRIAGTTDAQPRPPRVTIWSRSLLSSGVEDR